MCQSVLASRDTRLITVGQLRSLGSRSVIPTRVVDEDYLLGDLKSEWFSGGEASSGSFLSLDYNLYYGTSNGWSLNGSLYTTLSTWRSALGGSENGDEYHSVSGADPLLANPNGGDFTLSAGSPAAAMSSSSGPVGAYITGLECIGLEHLCSSSLATPSAVGASGNFSIQ